MGSRKRLQAAQHSTKLAVISTKVACEEDFLLTAVSESKAAANYMQGIFQCQPRTALLTWQQHGMLQHRGPHGEKTFVKCLLEVHGTSYYFKKPNARLQHQQIVKWKLTSRENKWLSDIWRFRVVKRLDMFQKHIQELFWCESLGVHISEASRTLLLSCNLEPALLVLEHSP